MCAILQTIGCSSCIVKGIIKTMEEKFSDFKRIRLQREKYSYTKAN